MDDQLDELRNHLRDEEFERSKLSDKEIAKRRIAQTFVESLKYCHWRKNLGTLLNNLGIECQLDRSDT